MPNATDFPARGKVIEVRDGLIVFNPVNTNYQLHLAAAPGAHAPVPQAGKTTSLIIRVVARKVYTVPPGGNFVAPIFGPPKTLQGRVRYVGPDSIVVHAGVPVVVSLPTADDALDLNNGPIGLDSLVNVVAMRGATYEPAASPAGVAGLPA